MRRSTTKQGTHQTHEMEEGNLSSVMDGLLLCQPALSLGKAKQENPTSSRSWWHKHRKVFTSSGERNWSVRMTCLFVDRYIYLLGWDGDCCIFTILYGSKLMVSSAMVFGVSCCISEVLSDWTFSSLLK